MAPAFDASAFEKALSVDRKGRVLASAFRRGHEPSSAPALTDIVGLESCLFGKRTGVRLQQLS
jgi:hypothetical protein